MTEWIENSDQWKGLRLSDHKNHFFHSVANEKLGGKKGTEEKATNQILAAFVTFMLKVVHTSALWINNLPLTVRSTVWLSSKKFTGGRHLRVIWKKDGSLE